MLIDVHTHIGHMKGDFPWGHTVGVAKLLRSFETGGRPWLDKDISKFEDMYWPNMDPEGEDSYKKAVELGIDRVVLLAIDFNLIGLDRYRPKGIYLATRSMEEVNKHFADVAARHSDKYIAFCGIDPRRGREGLELVGRAVTEWGMKGLKLMPTTGWFPNDREVCYPFYELCVDLDIPVMTHTGFEVAGFPARFSDPIYWDDVASDFPELSICIPHGGGGLSHVPNCHYLDVGISLALLHDNIYLDTAAAQALYTCLPVDFYRYVRRILDCVPGKLMWGTDSPVNLGLTWKEYHDVFRKPKREILEKAGVSFTEAEIDGLMGENAEHWLKLK